MKTNVMRTGSVATFLIPAFCLASALTASGVVYVWDGGGNVSSGANWGTTTSWNPDGSPGAGDTVNFDTTGNNVVTVDGDYSAFATDLGLSGTVSTTLTASGGTRTITLSGNSSNSRFRHSLTLDNVIMQKTGGAQLTMPATANAFTITLNNGAQLNIAASGVQGVWDSGLGRSVTSTSGTGSIGVVSGASLTLTGSSTWTFQSPITFTSAGTLNMTQGTLSLLGTTALSGTVDFNGATGSATISNAGTLTANSLTVNDTGANTALLRNTGGTMELSGTLALNAPMSITGGTLQGVTTSASGSGDVTISGTGMLSPAGTGVGTINLPDQLTFSGGSYAVDITSAGGSDEVVAGGAVALGSGVASLSVTSEAVTEGTIFTILSGSALTGTFAGLAEGATINTASQDYTINYTGTGVTLTAVPEPEFYAGAFGLGLLGYAFWNRRAKRA